MKKIAMSVLTAAALVMVSCTSAPTNPGAPQIQARNEVIILEHQNTILGGSVPAWVTLEQFELQAQDAYKDLYVYKIEGGNGEDLDGAKLAVNNFDANTAVARQVSNQVQQKFAGAQVGDKDKVETYMENVVKALAGAKFSGMRQEGQFWVQSQIKTADGVLQAPKFRVWVLYTIPKKLLEDQIAKILGAQDAAEQPKTEDERTARARVREALAGEL